MSVVMAVRNGAAYLSEAIASIRRQTLDDFELIVVDDGSTDETPRILAEQSSLDDRIRAVRGDGEGISRALNQACSLARGAYLARLDADDVALPERLASQVAFMEESPDVVLVGGAGIFIDEKGEEFARATYPSDPAEVATLLDSGRTPVMHPAATMRAESFRATSGYRPAVEPAEDYDLWLRLSQRGRIANLAQPVVRYRLHAGQSSTENMRRTATATAAALAAARLRARGGEDPLDGAASLTEPILDKLGVTSADIAESEVEYAFWLARTLARGGYDEQAKPLWALCYARSGATRHPGRERARVLRARAEICETHGNRMKAAALRALALVLGPATAATRVRGGSTRGTAES